MTPPKPPGRTDRDGFAVVELLTVLLIVGTLVRIAVPNVSVSLQRARAADIVGDVQVVQSAAVRYNAEGGAWPETTEPGVAPVDLEAFLPEGFDFRRDGHTLAWRRWDLPSGLPGYEDVGVLVGVTVLVEDEGMASALHEAVGDDHALMTLGDSYTFILPQGA